MTPRDRVLASIAHREPDRVPVDFWAREDVTERLMAHVGVASKEDLLRHLEVDLRTVTISEHIREFEERTTGVLGGRSARSGRRYILHEDGCFEDAWGVVRRLGADGLYEEWVSGPFVEDRDLDGFAWPEGEIYESVETLRRRVEAFEGRYAVMGSVDLPFKAAWQMRGLENFLCDMLLDPAYARELLDRVAVYETQKALRLVRAGVDIVGIYGDLAMQDRMLVQPEAWRRIEKPVLAEMIAALRGVRADVRILFHSDGDVTEIIPDYIEVGADLLNPIQPECMDPVVVKRRYGDRLALHGTISIQRTLPRGTPDDVRREVRQRVETCGQGGGLILGPSNLIQNDTPIENILALYETPLRG